ncbi:10834_t:CDS:1 [Ambispora leptoticha]|uniref:10834_t:CDS:1 n=1 Tax=Ambispora leptoticha TaxID=144679 RepID=A0A9N9BPA9_9GLOM|nr:10834_t:CDS:1 [Ambispora leptoticha]
MLEPYRKIIQRSNENTQVLEKEKKDLSTQLNTSQQKYESLKKFLKRILVSLSEDNQKELVNELNNEIETREKSTPSVYSTEIKTTELTSSLEISIKEMKELKKELETNLVKSEAKIQELEKGLIEVSSKQLEKMKSEFVEKRTGYNLINKKENLEKIRRKLEIYLDAHEKIIRDETDSFAVNTKKDAEEYLGKNKSEFIELLNELCEKQKEITLLKIQEQFVEEQEEIRSGVKGVQIVNKEKRSEMENTKTLEYRDKSSKLKVGVQIDPSTKNFNFGITREKTDVVLNTYEAQHQKNELTELVVQSVVGSQFKQIGQSSSQIKETDEQNQQTQTQIEQPPK